MCRTVILEWAFEPHDFFEEGMDLEHLECTLRIRDGKAEAHIPYEIYEQSPERRRELEELLNNRLLAVQALSHVPYTLSGPNRTDIDENGKRHIFAEMPAMKFTMSVKPVNFIHKDAEGNIIYDSKQERIDRKKSFADTIMSLAPSNQLLTSLLRSYKAAVDDPSNELVHLYEIRDALAAHYRGDAEAREAVGISNAKWSRFGQICNSEPLVQGRHRGRSSQEIREATKEELETVRAIALGFIEGYVATLTV